MFKSKRLMASLLAGILVLALLPFSALALTSDVLEEAPEIRLQSAGDDGAEYVPLDFYTDRGIVPEEQQYEMPRLSDAELERITELMAALKAGEVSFSGPSAANAAEQVTVGVYPLDPKDFDGETFYVILPAEKLNDQQLLSLVSAFEELGIAFNPDSLNGRNCSRSETGTATRQLADDESSRMEQINRMIIYGKLEKDAVHPETECRSVSSGSDTFCFYPYRRMTDDELAAFAFSRETAWDIDPDVIDRTARDFAHSLVRLPLALQTREMHTAESGMHLKVDGYTVRYTMPVDYDNRVRLRAGEPEEVTVWLYREPEFVISKHTGEAVPESLTIVYSAPQDIPASASSSVSAEDLKAAGMQWLQDNLNFPRETLISVWNVDTVGSYHGQHIDAECGYKGGSLQIRLFFRYNTTEVCECQMSYHEDIRPNVPALP